MKLFYIDTEDGFQAILPEDELEEKFTHEELENLKSNENNIFRQLNYTMKQYNKALRLRESKKWCEDFEDEHTFAPSLKDILEHLYGVR